jgi:hypothetical protein
MLVLDLAAKRTETVSVLVLLEVISTNLFLKELNLTHIFKLGILAAAMLASVGCSNTKPQEDANTKSKNLQQDPEYAKQMQGKMGGATPSAK